MNYESESDLRQNVYDLLNKALSIGAMLRFNAMLNNMKIGIDSDMDFILECYGNLEEAVEAMRIYNEKFDDPDIKEMEETFGATLKKIRVSFGKS